MILYFAFKFAVSYRLPQQVWTDHKQFGSLLYGILRFIHQRAITAMNSQRADSISVLGKSFDKLANRCCNGGKRCFSGIYQQVVIIRVSPIRTIEPPYIICTLVIQPFNSLPRLFLSDMFQVSQTFNPFR
jgi:hypothetical protein